MPSQISKIPPRFYKTLKSWAPLVGCLIALNTGVSRIPHFCLFESIFNWHCPFCGLTHACELLLQGRFVQSLDANLLAFPFAIVLMEGGLGKRFERPRFSFTMVFLDVQYRLRDSTAAFQWNRFLN